ncbi:MAG: metallophosphoesterase [Dehalococcoidia bacterium]
MHILRWLRWTPLPLGLGFGLLAYARFVEPRWLQVRRWEVELPGLAPAWDGYRIVQLSDFHVGGPGVSLRTLRRAFERAIALRPDLIVLTGDFMHHGRWRLEGEGLFEPLSQAAPAFAVLGNHDHLSNEDDTILVADGLRRQGITVLRNEWALVGPPGAEGVVVGLEASTKGHPDLLAAVATKPEGMAPLLLLTHVPDIIDQIPEGWFRLALAGHTHGAQIRLSPFEQLSWLQLGITENQSNYPRGFYQRNGLVLYVNRGLGMSEWPLRFGARPEITLLVIRRTNGMGRQHKPWRPVSQRAAVRSDLR